MVRTQEAWEAECEQLARRPCAEAGEATHVWVEPDGRVVHGGEVVGRVVEAGPGGPVFINTFGDDVERLTDLFFCNHPEAEVVVAFAGPALNL